MKKLITYILLGLSLFTYSQKKEKNAKKSIDSIKQILENKTLSSKGKIENMRVLINLYIYTNELEKLININNKLSLLTTKEKDTFSIALSHKNYAVIEQNLGKFQRLFNDVHIINNSASAQDTMPEQIVRVEKDIRKFLQ